jgi:tetratricopeptide (TPR) repeat protein
MRSRPARPSRSTPAAEVLPDLYQYAAAERYAKLAADRAPLWADPQHLLGKMYMHTAREEEASAAFEAAYALDPYNITTVNYIRILDDMKSFETVKSPNFVIKFDTKLDPILGEYLGPSMEKAFAEVTERFKYKPPQPTILEVFPTTTPSPCARRAFPARERTAPRSARS